MKPKLKLIINALPLLSPLTGIGRYLYEISKNIQTNDTLECSFFYGYFSKKLTTPTTSIKIKSLKNSLTKNQFTKTVARKLLFTFSGLFSKKYDIYWEPNFIPLKSIKSKKTIITVHDFSWELYPEFQPSERVKYFKDNFYTQIKKSHHIIAVSHFTKQEIVERTGCSPEKISVIHNGIDHTIFYKRDLEKPTQKYILAVGNIEPRKNLKNLLLAYSLLDETMKDEYHLILVGAKGWKNNEIMNSIHSLQKWVRYSGYVDDEALAKLYNQASLFIYPSIYEGFGIPLLEAMGCGTPVICSNTSSIPEVGGDAVVYCNPLDIEDIKDKIKLVINDKNLRQQLIQKGLKRANQFNWENSAKTHLELFTKLKNDNLS